MAKSPWGFYSHRFDFSKPKSLFFKSLFWAELTFSICKLQAPTCLCSLSLSLFFLILHNYCTYTWCNVILSSREELDCLYLFPYPCWLGSFFFPLCGCNGILWFQLVGKFIINSNKIGNTDIDSLSDGVIIDILSRLPVDCILECQRVCRRWRALTSKPCFDVFQT